MWSALGYLMDTGTDVNRVDDWSMVNERDVEVFGVDEKSRVRSLADVYEAASED